MRLDIGSGNPEQGEVQPAGYVLCDIEKHKNIDLVCDVRELKKYVPDGFCSEIRASHILEHFGMKEMLEIIKTVHNLLEDHGKFTIFVPNFKYHALLAHNGYEDSAIYYAFGGQLDEYDYHKTGFTANLLRKYLEDNSFKVLSLTEETVLSCYAEKI